MNERLISSKEIQANLLEKYHYLNQYAVKNAILFTGSSLMEHFPINELVMSKNNSKIIYNRGVGGFTTEDFLKNMETLIFDLSPSRIFINIGTNDISDLSYTLDNLLKNYRCILTQIQSRLPDANIYIMAYYPVNETILMPDAAPNDEWVKNRFVSRNNASLKLANKAVERLAAELGCSFLDVNADLTDECGRLKETYTVEGIHMNPKGYEVALQNLLPYL